jgi:ribosomal protein S12 methylthiotransferase accessory factor YcaO
VTLGTNDDERTGFAEGSVAASARPRLLAEATLDSLRQLEPAAECLDVDTALVSRAGAHDVVVVVLVAVDPPREQHLAGSAIVYQHPDDAVVRAVLDATNRRLPNLARDRDRF